MKLFQVIRTSPEGDQVFLTVGKNADAVMERESRGIPLRETDTEITVSEIRQVEGYRVFVVDESAD